MTLPRWLSRKGLAQHVLVGLGATLALGWWLAPWLLVTLALIGGILHELWDGDLTRAPGAPLNGVIDILAFLPAPLVWWAMTVIHGW